MLHGFKYVYVVCTCSSDATLFANCTIRDHQNNVSAMSVG